MVEHERYQTDSYSIHHLADTILIDGYAKWTIHPLSYVGYYPLSYPMGVPMLLAEFSAISGLNLESAILVECMIIAAVFSIGVFLLVRRFTQRAEIALLATILTTLGPRFIDTTYWDASARGLAILLMILLFVALIKLNSNRSHALLYVSLLLGMGCISVHHMAVVILIFALAYVTVTFVTVYIIRILRLRKRSHITALHLLAAAIIIIAPIMLFEYFMKVALRVLDSSALINFESSLLTVIVAAGVSYVSQIGLVVPFAALYIPIMMKRSNLTTSDLFPFYAIVLFLPLFGEALYISMIIAPFVAILGALWFADAFRRSERKGFIAPLLALLIAASIVLPIGMTGRWNSTDLVGGDQVVVDGRIFNDANYGLYNSGSGYAVCNAYHTESRLTTLSRMDFLGSGIVSILNGDVDSTSVRENISRGSTTFPRNLYNWYDYSQELDIDFYIRKLILDGTSTMDSPIGFGAAVDYFSDHSHLIIVVDNRWTSHYVTAYSIRQASLPSELFTSIPSSLNDSNSTGFASYAYYRSDLVTMFLVQLV